MRKTVIFIADSLDNAHKFQQVLSGLDVRCGGGVLGAVQEAAVRSTLSYDLVIYEARADALATLSQVEVGAARGRLRHRLLVIVNEAHAARVPSCPAVLKSDFVVHGAEQRGVRVRASASCCGRATRAPRPIS